MSPILSMLYRKYGKWLRAKGRALGAQDPEELAQQAFLRVIAAGRQEEVLHPRALLATIATNLHRDGRRKEKAHGGPAFALDDLPESFAPWTSPDQEATLLLKQVILGLPPIYRDTFILNRFIGMTFAEIAERQGVTIKAIEYRMSRALAHCAEALRD